MNTTDPTTSTASPVVSRDSAGSRPAADESRVRATDRSSATASGPGVGHALLSELTRLAGLRSVWIFAILLTGTLYGPAVLMSAFGDTDTGSLLSGIDFFVFIAMIFAAADSASVIGNKSVAFGYLSRRSRWTGHVARFLAQLAFVLVTFAVGVAVAAPVMLAGGVEIANTATDFALALGLAFAWTTVSSAVGMLIPVTAAAVAIPLLWVALIEGVLPMLPFDFMDRVVEYLPWFAGRQLLGFMDIGVSDAHAVAVLSGWSVVLVVTGLAAAVRRDIR